MRMRMRMNEGTESNPRFKCMENGTEDENTMYMLETEDEAGEVREFSVDLADESDWGNINTVNGTCYFASGEEFDGIGWGNDEDGYEKITRVVDMGRGKDVPLEEFAEIVDSLVELFSDM